MSGKHIFYLGDLYSFHHIAATAFFGNENTFIGLSSFDEIIQTTLADKNNYAVLAVENTLAGDVPMNFERITGSGLEIIGEINVPVQLCLAAKNVLQLSEIKEVYSHQMAIKESTAFFANYLSIQFILTPSTATAVKMVAASEKNDIAAIGNKSAINYYHLQIIADKIDDHASNLTRFLILSKNKIETDTTFSPKKASLLLQPKLGGALVNIENNPQFTLHRNLETGNVYIETVDLTPEQLFNLKVKFEQDGHSVKVLGAYPAGITIDN